MQALFNNISQYIILSIKKPFLSTNIVKLFIELKILNMLLYINLKIIIALPKLEEKAGFMENCSFKQYSQYPLMAYSEFMPPVHFTCRAQNGKTKGFFQKDAPLEFPITEHEESFELQPGLENIAHQILKALSHLAKGETAEGLAKNKLINNPYWPDELAGQAQTLRHEPLVIILPLALSLTQDDKGRKRWTFFGASEQGPFRSFWKSFFTSPQKAIPPEEATGFIRSILNSAYGESCNSLSDLLQVGFRIFASKGDPQKVLRPAWTLPFIWTDGMDLKGVKYLLSFEPFGTLPETVKKAYLNGSIHLLPFPGSLLFWGVPGYQQMQSELFMSNQIPLLHLVERHEAPYGLRVPQSGWIHLPSRDNLSPHEGFGPLRSTYRRTHRGAKVHRYEDELAVPGHLDHILHVLFSTDPNDLNLYGKPMARNSQIWTQNYKLLLDGPNSTKTEIKTALAVIKQGGLFGYRFQYPPLIIESHQIYWHLPLVAYLPPHEEKPVVLPEALSGYFTAYDAEHPDLDHPIELCPHIYKRNLPQTIIKLFKDKTHEHKTITRVLNLLTARENLGKEKLPYSFARQILTLPENKMLDDWLESLRGCDDHNVQGQCLGDQLRDLIAAEEKQLPSSGEKALLSSLTFSSSTLRSFEIQYWKDICALSAGKYLNKANSDCILDAITQKKLIHHQRDLEALGDYLLDYYRQVINEQAMQGKALAGDLPFKWETDFDFDWWGGWVKNQDSHAHERNIMMVIPGRNRQRAVIMADHYDTAYMADIYYKDQGGSCARIASAGADDNHSATATLMRAAPIFCDLSRKGKLDCDIWLIHLTGEEFPSDCLGSRHLCQQIAEKTLKLHLPDGEKYDLSSAEIQGVFVLDMIAHNNEAHPYIFQISPGTGPESIRLAYQAHIANEIWNICTEVWNKCPSRSAQEQGKRSPDGKIIPQIALHPKLNGQVRLSRDPLSTLYNTDGQIFSDAGIPVVLFMENYDISRKGYHDSQDTMANIDLDYGAAIAAIAIETVALVATEQLKY